VDHRDIIAIGASAGGVPALQTLVGGLSAELDAAVFVVLHIPVYTSTKLHEVLERAGPLASQLASDGEKIKRGRIYVAPNDRHLVVEDGRIRLTRGPRENRVRPCIDVLFRSLALEFGPRVVGVVLSGMLDDGTAGLWAIKDRGGVSIVQDPEDAEHASMPRSALKHVSIDQTLPIEAIGSALTRLTSEELTTSVGSLPPRSMELETRIAIEGNALKRGVMEMGEISKNTCPECHGVLVRIREGSIVRFRCHTGHAFSLQTLLVDTDKAIDDSLWNAIRAIEERALILREMQELAVADGHNAVAEGLAREATDAEQRAQRIRDLVVVAPAAA
jgi:two-component system chemotaxis response regulator CheB